MSLNSLDILLAQAPSAGTVPNQTGQIVQMIGMFLIIGFAYIFVISRPQAKKTKAHAALLNAMKPGDKVVTSGGVVGTIVSVKERTVSLRSADAKMEVLKSAVSEITERAGEGTVAESQSSKS